MGQIEHAQGLSHNLVEHMVVVASILSCSVDRANGRDVGSRHIHAVVVARQRQQLVLLQRQVHAHVQVPILCLHRRYRESYLKSLVRHRAYVGKQLVVGKGRHRHVVGVQHICGFRVVIFGRQHQSVVPQSYLAAYIECRLCLPL